MFMFLCLFALTGCHIWAPVCNLIAASKMVKFDPSFFGLFTKGLLAMTRFFAFQNGSGSQTFAKSLPSKCIFRLAVLLKSKIVFFCKIPSCSLILNTKRVQYGSEANFLCQIWSFLSSKCAFCVNSF